jgi:predicted acetyltransferase
VHTDIDDRGEPMAMLGASEGGIYERFGYGIASWMRVVEIAPRTVSMRPEFVPPHHGVRFLSGDDARRHTDAVWERYRRTRPTEVTRNEAWQTMIAADRAIPQDGLSEAYTLAHRDGYASYRLVDKWNMGLPMHELHLGEFAAVTAEAHAALWSLLLSIDLVGMITTSQMPIDDPLPYLLTNHRAVRTINLKDGYWANVRDPATCFAARTYGSDDRLVVESDGVRWAIEGGADGGSCRRVRTKPDLITDVATLGCLLFGSTTPSQLAAGRRLGGSTAALRRADAFFATSPAPCCQTHY